MVWDADGGFATHSFRGHSSIVTSVSFQPSSVSVTRCVSGSEDGQVEVWDLVTSAHVATLAEHTSAVTSMCFSPDPSAALLVTSGRDSVCCVWDTREIDLSRTGHGQQQQGGKGGAAGEQALTQACLKASIPAMEAIEGVVTIPEGEIRAGGSAAVTGLDFVSVGDKGGLRRWRVQVSGATRAERKYGVGCIAAQSVTGLRRGQRCEASAAGLPDRGLAKIAAGLGKASTADAGDVPTAKQFERLLLRPLPSAEGSHSGVKRGRPSEAGSSYELLAVTRDQVLTLTHAAELTARKTIVGYHDQFTDVRYIPRPLGSTGGGAPALIAVATNSEQLRIVDTSTLNARLCDGHEDVVLSVSASPEGTLVATASKDSSVRLWDVATGVCVAIGAGHTEAATAVAFPVRPSSFLRMDPATGSTVGKTAWLASGSRDRTLKLWQLAPVLSTLPSPRPATWGSGADSAWLALTQLKQAHTLRTTAAVVAHEKDINAITVAKTDSILATGSADKSIKLWSMPDLGLLATLRGHKRGVWAVAFSPTEPILASCSGDRTIRVWGVTPQSGYACLRTLEGHDSSVLCVRFLRAGAQLVSTGADGLLKLWSPSTGDCMGTFEAHADKVWSLAVRPVEHNESMPEGDQAALQHEEELVTAGADSVLNVWKDVTGEMADVETAAAESALARQSELYAAMSARDYPAALRLTLDLDQPGRCGDIFGELLECGPLPAPPSVIPGVPSQPGAMEAYTARMLAEVRSIQGMVKGQEEGSSMAQHGAGPAAAAAGGVHPEGHKIAVQLLTSLSGPLLTRLLTYIRDWNTQSRHGFLAQRLLHLLLHHVSQARLLQALAEAKGLLARTEARVLPGVGTVRVAKARGELEGESSGSLAPLAKSTRGDGEEEGVVGVLKAAAPPPTPVHTAAVAELQAFVSSSLPYTVRHSERLERLRQAGHVVGMTVERMHALLPLAEEEQEEGGAGGSHAQALSSQGARTRMVSVRDDEEEDMGSSESEASEAGRGGRAQVKGRGGRQWLGSKQ